MTPPATASLDRALVLFVDLQAPFLSAVAGGDALARRCAFVLEAAHGLGIGTAFTEQVPAKLGPTIPALLALEPEPRVFAKEAFSALEAPGLREFLEARAVRHLLLAGIETPICIYQTSLAALGAGIEVTLLTDCLGGRRPDDCATALDHLARLGAHPLPAETVLYSILQTTRHPFFRAFTQLVKRYAAAP